MNTEQELHKILTERTESSMATPWSPWGRLENAVTSTSSQKYQNFSCDLTDLWIILQCHDNAVATL